MTPSLLRVDLISSQALAPLNKDIEFFSLHGHLPPQKRSLALSQFRNHPSTSSSPAILLCTDVAARGLDLPSVDIVIQFDAPVDPKQFSHRCGRTARAGRDGRAWVLLCGRETEYVDFLAIRKIPLRQRGYIDVSGATTAQDEERLADPGVADLEQRMRTVTLTDRDLYDRVSRSFVAEAKTWSSYFSRARRRLSRSSKRTPSMRHLISSDSRISIL